MHGKPAGNEARWLFPRLLSFLLPCPITDIRIIMLQCDGGVFSHCPEAAFLSAHKHLWEWVNYSVGNALPESVITASGLNCQPLTTGHMQRNDTLKLMAVIKYQTGANSYQVGWWSFYVTLFDDLDNPRFNTSGKDGQWGVYRLVGKKRTAPFKPSWWQLPLFYFLWASSFSQKNCFAFLLPAVFTSYSCSFVHIPPSQP